jgi:hypothetical protein
MVGEDTVVLFGGYTGGTGQGQALDLRRVDVSGATVYGDIRVQNDPNFVAWPRLQPLGDALVVAWISLGQPGRVGLAKFTP